MIPCCSRKRPARLETALLTLCADDALQGPPGRRRPSNHHPQIADLGQQCRTRCRCGAKTPAPRRKKGRLSMCGITGLFDSGPRAPSSRADPAMTDVIAHRGPDGSGSSRSPGWRWVIGGWRSSIWRAASSPCTPPMARSRSSSMAKSTISRSCARELEALGAEFLTNSDTEVLLHGWRHWATAMLDRLRGMFAFALWDAPSRRCSWRATGSARSRCIMPCCADGTWCSAPRSSRCCAARA